MFKNNNLDFTDRLTRRKKAMYRSYVRRPAALETNEYELLPKDLELQETSIQKLRRLKFEIQELNEEIEKNDKGDVKYILLCKGLWIKKGIISYVIFNDLSLSNL